MAKIMKADEAFFEAVRNAAGLDSKTGSFSEPEIEDGDNKDIRLCLIEGLSSYETSLPHSTSQLYIVKDGNIEGLADILRIAADDFECVSDIYCGEYHENGGINRFLSDIDVKKITMGGDFKEVSFSA